MLLVINLADFNAAKAEQVSDINIVVIDRSYVWISKIWVKGLDLQWKWFDLKQQQQPPLPKKGNLIYNIWFDFQAIEKWVDFIWFDLAYIGKSQT